MRLNQQKYSGIILAGGQGKRMGGQDKGLLDYNNKKLIEHTLDIIKPLTNDIVISANRNIKTYLQYSNPVISDATEGYQGPLAGLYAAMPYCAHSWIFVLPCDMPLLSTAILEKLADSKNNKLNARKKVFIAQASEKLQPVFLLHRSLHNTIKPALDQGQLRLMQWLKSFGPEVIPFTDSLSSHRLFNNFNTITAFNTEPPAEKKG